MAASGARPGPPIAETAAVVKRWRQWFAQADDGELGEGLIQVRETGIDPLEAAFAVGLRRFDKWVESASEGALSAVAWLRSRVRFAGGAAAEHVGVARQMEQLPQTSEAFAKGELSYQHVAVLARTAEHVGAAAVRKEEANLLKAAGTMDAGQFVGFAKNFEHRVDAEAVLGEANPAYGPRYLNIGEPSRGPVRAAGL